VTGSDEPRFLHRDVARNYTTRSYLAVRAEPECVDEATQRELSREARRRRARELRGDWRVTRRTILAAIAGFREGTHGDRLVADALRVLERGIARLDRHLDELAR
jgi:hypothetical protein